MHLYGGSALVRSPGNRCSKDCRHGKVNEIKTIIE